MSLQRAGIGLKPRLDEQEIAWGILVRVGLFHPLLLPNLFLQQNFNKHLVFEIFHAEKFKTKPSPAVDLKIQGLLTVAQCKIVTIHSKPVMLKKNTYNNYILWPHTTALGQFLKKTIKRCKISRFRTSWQAQILVEVPLVSMFNH